MAAILHTTSIYSSSSICIRESSPQFRNCFFSPQITRSANAAVLQLSRPKLELPISSPKEFINCLLEGEDLSEEEAEASLNFLLSDGNEAVISAFLVLLRAKGETFEEIVGFARAMIKCCRKVEGIDDAVDIVGTGGDGANTVNISTGAAILFV